MLCCALLLAQAVGPWADGSLSQGQHQLAQCRQAKTQTLISAAQLFHRPTHHTALVAPYTCCVFRASFEAIALCVATSQASSLCGSDNHLPSPSRPSNRHASGHVRPGQPLRRCSQQRSPPARCEPASCSAAHLSTCRRLQQLAGGPVACALGGACLMVNRVRERQEVRPLSQSAPSCMHAFHACMRTRSCACHVHVPVALGTLSWCTRLRAQRRCALRWAMLTPAWVQDGGGAGPQGALPAALRIAAASVIASGLLWSSQAVHAEIQASLMGLQRGRQRRSGDG